MDAEGMKSLGEATCILKALFKNRAHAFMGHQSKSVGCLVRYMFY